MHFRYSVLTFIDIWDDAVYEFYIPFLSYSANKSPLISYTGPLYGYYNVTLLDIISVPNVEQNLFLQFTVITLIKLNV